MNILTFFRGRRVSKLYDEGQALIESYQFEEALEIAQKLRKLQHSSAFEIEALAYAGLDRKEDAVRALREGLELAPAAWPNWMLLGSYLSDLERYDEASLAYDRAEACEGADPSVVNLNRSIIASRQDDYESALRYLSNLQYESREMELRAMSLRIEALHQLGRNDEAEAAGVRTLDAWRDAREEEGKDDIAAIATCVATIRLERGEDRAGLLAFAMDWRKRTRGQEMLWTIREIRGQRSNNAQQYNLVLHAPGVFLNVDAVADSPEEALGFVRELEPEEFAIDEVKTIAPTPDEPKGIYSMSGRIFYKE